MLRNLYMHRISACLGCSCWKTLPWFVWLPVRVMKLDTLEVLEFLVLDLIYCNASESTRVHTAILFQGAVLPPRKGNHNALELWLCQKAIVLFTDMQFFLILGHFDSAGTRFGLRLLHILFHSSIRYSAKRLMKYNKSAASRFFVSEQSFFLLLQRWIMTNFSRLSNN